MASLMEEFVSVLEQENVGYQELVTLSNQKTELIIKADIEQLNEITTEEQAILDRLAGLEKKRTAVRRNMADVLNTTPDQLTLLHMAEMFAGKPEQQQQLTDLRENLRLTLIEVAKVNTKNEMLLRQAMEMLNFDMNLMKSLRQAPATNNYGKNAYNTDSYLPMGGFDTKQ